jgi:hypothetical protein
MQAYQRPIRAIVFGHVTPRSRICDRGSALNLFARSPLSAPGHMDHQEIIDCVRRKVILTPCS